MSNNDNMAELLNGLQALITQATRPMPSSLDGLYSSDVIPQVIKPSVVDDLLSQIRRTPNDIKLLLELEQVLLNGGGLVYDRKYVMEQVIQLAASFPANSETANKLTGALVKNLWNNLHHPPLSYLGDDYKYRMPDGSNNNIMYPNLGKANGPYARSVAPMTNMPAVPPDAGLIFDTLLARDNKFQEHPNKISSTLFYLASIIIHDLFLTDYTDTSKTTTSSYLDLAPLYGSSLEAQLSVRTMEDGLLKPDAFYETRLLGFPPGVAALLVCFNRFHNYVARELATINEGGRFTMPEATDDKACYEKALAKRDNDLFQTARLVTGGLYVNIILKDYVNTILATNKTNTKWTLDPRENYDPVFNSEGTPVGVGNEVSVEFNLIYRWHAAISKRDEEWTNNFYKSLYPEVETKTLDAQGLKTVFHAWVRTIPSNPGERTFGGLKRNKDGYFDDAELNKIMVDGIEDIAGAFGARNVPDVLKTVEILGIEQARKWKVASLNEFRKFFGLQPYTSFDEINSDPNISSTLEALYTHPDFVELYPGILVEDSKKPMTPGSGLCPGYTISKAILSDATTLVRSDRFYTVDYNPGSLTHWGFAQAGSNPDVANNGVIYKLIMRAFPGYYRSNSVYALYPFIIPKENLRIHKSLGIAEKFNYDKPQLYTKPQHINAYDTVLRVLEDSKTFAVPWGRNTFKLTRHDYMLSGDKAAHKRHKDFVADALYTPDEGLKEIREFYEKTTKNLILKASAKLGKYYQLDAVRDVGNPSHAHFAAQLFHIPLKTEENQIGLYTENELYACLATLYAYIFEDIDTASSFALGTKAERYVNGPTGLSTVLKGVIESLRTVTFISSFKQSWGFEPSDSLSSYGTTLIDRMSEGGKSIDEVVWTIIPTASNAVASQGQSFAQMLNLFLSEEYNSHWPDIHKLAMSDEPADFDLLIRYAMEALRLSECSGVIRSVTADDTIIDDGAKELTLNKNETVFLNFQQASIDPKAFPDPLKIKLDRPLDSYIHFGHGSHACLGSKIVMNAMAAQLKVFGRLKGLRRVPGLAGQMKSKDVDSGLKVYMTEDWREYWPFPTTMKVMFDEMMI